MTIAVQAPPPPIATARCDDLVMPLLFSYGTLRDPAVQRANFGRELVGREDGLPGYTVRMLAITDPQVVAVSEQTHHPIVVRTGDGADRVDGAVFDITDDELAAADDYEVDDYRRISVVLASGVTAWVYVSAEQSASEPR